MQRIFFFILFITIGIFPQVPIEKFSGSLKKVISIDSTDHLLVWVSFKDKDGNEELLSKPETFLNKKALTRRNKIGTNISFEDLPVSGKYIAIIESLGCKIKQKSKWFNSVSVYTSKNILNKISQLDFVKNIDVVQSYPVRKTAIDSTAKKVLLKTSDAHLLNYGVSFPQLEQLKVPEVHDLGYSGKGINIAMLDAGFSDLGHIAFNSLNVIAKWDFVNNDSCVANQNDMGEGSHGTATLSVIGGKYSGYLYGPAFNANYILAKTENTDSETPIEEDNWIAAAEWADSIGVDIISTSLGYLQFDLPYPSLTYEDMNGKTAKITIAADLAVKKGIVVVVSAGNEGYDPTHNTLGAPADGDSVITAGAVRDTGERTDFSSVGPTADGRIKPDVCAMGEKDYVAVPFTTKVGTSSGTSFSCPLVAGCAALLLEANPNLTPIQVRDILRSTASQSNSPDNLLGWGIVDIYKAIHFTTYINDKNNNSTISDFTLAQNFPNPFNPSTNIEFYLQSNTQIQLYIINVLGQKIKELTSGIYGSGKHVIEFNAGNLSSGIYFAVLKAGNQIKSIKMSLIK